jgi:hypothetical protein
MSEVAARLRTGAAPIVDGAHGEISTAVPNFRAMSHFGLAQESRQVRF